jgi:hypothetical protein
MVKSQSSVAGSARFVTVALTLGHGLPGCARKGVRAAPERRPLEEFEVQSASVEPATRVVIRGALVKGSTHRISRPPLDDHWVHVLYRLFSGRQDKPRSVALARTCDVENADAITGYSGRLEEDCQR